ncbi:MAG: hypothetical protein LBD23_10315 [Oscillospiraceae bacterium]|jgi:hypothetical protein|nr:hypothetical protein [Oscillospiraceae bacterium]
MKNEIIEKYLTDVLRPQLDIFGASLKFVKTVTNTIRNQIHSCIYYWDDEMFRKGLLVIDAEEGLFYEPIADNDIRSFVVVAIRNSELEWLQSDNHTLAGLKLRYDDSYVKHITSAAIKYFKDVDFMALSQELDEPTHDVYGDLCEKYPAALLALMAIATVGKTIIGYERTKTPSTPDLSILPIESNVAEDLSRGNRMTFTRAMTDGMSFSIDQSLLDILKYSAEKRMPFISDSFKSVSRNIDKLLLIMEYVLRNDIPFVTSNYFITDHYIECRAKIVRAGHDREEMIRNWKNKTGLCENHAYALKCASDGLK